MNKDEIHLVVIIKVSIFEASIKKNVTHMDIKGRYMVAANRYDDAEALYQRCGKSGIRLPKVSLGFWHNFGGVDTYERSRAITH